MTGKVKFYRKCNNIRPCRMRKTLSPSKLCYLNLNDSNVDIITHSKIMNTLYDLVFEEIFKSGKDVSFTNLMTLGLRKRKLKYKKPIYQFRTVNGKATREEVVLFDTDDYQIKLVKLKLNNLFYLTYSIRSCKQLRRSTYENRLNYNNYLNI